MQTLTVSLSLIRAARSHAAEKDLRYYLQGVYFDTKNGKLVSTDGHRMLIASASGIQCNVSPFIIANETLDAVLSQYKGDYARGKRSGDIDITVTVSDEMTVSFSTPIGLISGKPLDGTFPDYRRVIPKPEDVMTESPAVFNQTYIYEAFDAILIARNKTLKAASNYAVKVFGFGDSCGVVTDGSSGVVVIVMPIRKNEIHSEAAAAACREALSETVTETQTAAAA